jgi:selenophosphate synthase
LILTKALGTGVISTAIKKGKAQPAWIDAAVRSMTTLNKTAAEVITGGRVGSGLRPGQVERDSTNGQRAGAGDVQHDRARAALQHNRGRAALQGRESAPEHDGASAPALDVRFTVHSLTDVTGFGLIGHAREMALASDVSLTISAKSVALLEGALECVHAGFIPAGLRNNRDFAECMVDYEDEIPEEVKALLFDPQTAGGLLISTPDGERLTRALKDVGVEAAPIGKVLSEQKPRIRVTK